MNPNGYVLLRELPTVWKKVNKENWDSCKLGTIELARVPVDNCAWSDKVVKNGWFHVELDGLSRQRCELRVRAGLVEIKAIETRRAVGGCGFSLPS
jgi:hypothetical protein